ncbi:MAG: hypothetical protein QOE35_3241 [Actinomycetota bacterium]|jgi:hypothetical protein
MAQERSPSDLIETLAFGRIAFGVALMAAPALTSFGYLGREASRPSVRFLNRIFGGRDVALGAWVLLSRGNKEAYRQAVMAGMACDAWDAVAALTTKGAIPRFGKPLTAAVAGGAVAVAAMALRDLET